MTDEKPKSSAWFRPFRFILKFFIFILFMNYLYIGASSTWQLVKMNLNRKHDISNLQQVIRVYIKRDQLDKITEWVHYRPAAETDALIKILTPASSDLEPLIFFEIAARKLRQDNIEEALFWSQLGRYRIRYDALRCGPGDPPPVLTQMLDLLSSPKISALLAEHPELLKKTLRKVLDFDKKYPAQNSPAFICKMVKKLNRDSSPLVPKKNWGNIRQQLRITTEVFLNSPDNTKIPDTKKTK